MRQTGKKSEPKTSRPAQIGNAELLSLPKTAFLSSRKISPDAVMGAHGWAVKVREGTGCIIGGFQSDLEKDVLKFLLRGSCPIVIVRGNRCPKTMPVELRAAAAANRILIVSLPAMKNSRTGETSAMRRNQYVLDHAEDYVFGALDPAGKLAKLAASLDPAKMTVLG